MELNDVKQFFVDNKDSEDVQSFLNELNSNTELKIDTVKNYLLNDADGKKLYFSLLDSEADRKANERMKKELPGKIKEELQKNPVNKSPEFMELKGMFDSLKGDYDTLKNDFDTERRSKLMVIAKNQFPNAKPEVLERFLGNNEEETKSNLTSLGEMLKGGTKEEVVKVFKDNGIQPKITKEKETDKKKFTEEDWQTMSSDDFINYG